MSVGLQGWQWALGVIEFALAYLPFEVYVRRHRKVPEAALVAETNLAEAHKTAQELEFQRHKLMKLQAEHDKLMDTFRALNSRSRKPPKGGAGVITRHAEQQLLYQGQIPHPMIGHVPTNRCDGCGTPTPPSQDESLCGTCQRKRVAMQRIRTRTSTGGEVEMWGVGPIRRW